MKKEELAGIIEAAEDSALAGCQNKNPLEAWTRFIDRLDAMGRRKIGHELQAAGHNRITGKRNEEDEKKGTLTA